MPPRRVAAGRVFRSERRFVSPIKVVRPAHAGIRRAAACPRHCERSEAIHRAASGDMDCFAALAMTAGYSFTFLAALPANLTPAPRRQPSNLAHDLDIRALWLRLRL